MLQIHIITFKILTEENSYQDLMEMSWKNCRYKGKSNYRQMGEENIVN